jgi:hypothetical protein
MISTTMLMPTVSSISVFGSGSNYSDYTYGFAQRSTNSDSTGCSHDMKVVWESMFSENQEHCQ